MIGSSLPWRDGQYQYPNHQWAALSRSISNAIKQLSFCRRKLTAIFERIQEALVHELTASKVNPAQLPSTLVSNIRLVITLVLLAGLLLEPQSLVEGVVQLGVRVRNLLLADECPIKQSVSWTQKHHAAVRRHTQISRRDLFISG